MSQHMGVFNAYEILEYLSHEQKMVKGKESARTFKEQKKRENLTLLGVRPDTALCTLVGASSPAPGISF